MGVELPFFGVLAWAVLAASAVIWPTVATSQELRRNNAVLITRRCFNDAGEIVPLTLSGVIVSQDGHVLTSSDELACALKNERVGDRWAIEGRIGNYRGRAEALVPVRVDSQSGIVLLQFDLAERREFDTPVPCELDRPMEMTSSFFALGFPSGRRQLPVQLFLGETSGGRWFIFGQTNPKLSGSGVYFEKKLVGILQHNDVAEPHIAPISRIAQLVETETRIDPIQSCDVVDRISNGLAQLSGDDDGEPNPTTPTAELIEAVAGQEAESLELDPAVYRIIWPSGNPISVCWENPEAGSDSDRDLVRKSVEMTWAFYSGVRFTNWGVCEEDSRGVRIRISEDYPHVKKLGRQIDGMRDGMVVNFSFQNWLTSCREMREYCIRGRAVHNFGHILGFAPEQNRRDATADCPPAQGSDVPALMYLTPLYLTPYDANSVMNYCNKKWANDGYLSYYDIVKVRTLYGPP